jgi:hypothetical protein
VEDVKDVINIADKEYAEGTLAMTLYAEAVQIKEVCSLLLLNPRSHSPICIAAAVQGGTTIAAVWPSG